MTTRQILLCLGYALTLGAWVGAAPLFVVRDAGSRALSRLERGALRGGAPGGCQPQSNSVCDSDPLNIQDSCSYSDGTCDDYDDDCVDAQGNNVKKDTPCGGNLDDGQNPPQCQTPKDPPLSGCVQGSPPSTTCYDYYDDCTCDGNGSCGGDKSGSVDTGTCVTSP